jgi:hypothetical protein
MFTLTKKEDVEDFVRGTTFFGTGGGGGPQKGLQLLLNDFKNGKKLGWKDISELEGELWSVCPVSVGSISPETEEIKKKKEAIGFTKKTIVNPLINAVVELEKYTGKKAELIVAAELGGGNTPGPMDVAVNLNRILVDGDYTGRASPESVQSTAYLFGKNVPPVSAVDAYGDVIIIKDAINTDVLERIGKFISEATYGLAEAGRFLELKDLKKVIIPGTLTESFEIGKAVRLARENGKDPVEAITEKTHGYLLFEGKVSDKKWEDQEGYTVGTFTFTGENKFSQKEFKIWFKNENHISWLNGEVYVTSPDVIEVVRRKDGEPTTNTDLNVGEKVAIIGTKGRDVYRTEEGLNVFGPRHFGFDYKYVPIEKVMKNR